MAHQCRSSSAQPALRLSSLTDHGGGTLDLLTRCVSLSIAVSARQIKQKKSETKGGIPPFVLPRLNFYIHHKFITQMAIYGSIDTKNHGYGRRMDYAGKKVLESHFGGGHFSSVASHTERWSAFSEWAKETGIRDMRDITAEHISKYAAQMKDAGIAIATMHNRISTINTVLGHAREGDWRKVSPREMVGASRSQVRTEAPVMLDRDAYSAALSDLKSAGLDRAAAALGLARELGMRSEEASKADLDRLVREADRLGRIDVQEGTKGGRTAPRWVPVTEAGRVALQAAVAARPAGSRNLLAPGETYRAWREGELRAGRDLLHSHGARGYHDARAAYACERYAILTGHLAPAVAGHRGADRGADRAAREVIARELGHGRADVCRAYVGSSR